MACAYAGGVVLGADGRVSTGQYISNRSSNKITQLSDNVYLLRSGSAADTQASMLVACVLCFEQQHTFCLLHGQATLCSCCCDVTRTLFGTSAHVPCTC